MTTLRRVDEQIDSCVSELTRALERYEGTRNAYQAYGSAVVPISKTDQVVADIRDTIQDLAALAAVIRWIQVRPPAPVPSSDEIGENTVQAIRDIFQAQARAAIDPLNRRSEP